MGCQTRNLLFFIFFENLGVNLLNIKGKSNSGKLRRLGIGAGQTYVNVFRSEILFFAKYGKFSSWAVPSLLGALRIFSRTGAYTMFPLLDSLG